MKLAEGSADGLDQYLANQINMTFNSYFGGITISTTDTGTATGGVYTGIGKNNVPMLSSGFTASLLTLLKKDLKLSQFCSEFATVIDTAFSESKLIIVTTGTVTPAMGTPFPMTGTGSGKWTGNKALIESVLKIRFEEMNESAKVKGWTGYEDFADAVTDAVDSYCRAASVTVTYTGSIIGTGISTSIS